MPFPTSDIDIEYIKYLFDQSQTLNKKESDVITQIKKQKDESKLVKF